ncbi:FHA domain-containing protein [Rubrivivax sp. A210]|uniref:FHA domain-containing protein n=1 Tax=Rubrivivax sp. A210 TaxID=2772301 RepID=UPI001919BDBB|nr:FHA domain-containing protein [Rubrivivax sp. A210]CAD5372284.1 FHA domain-containing protein [Rubrivivax sp. A210]
MDSSGQERLALIEVLDRDGRCLRAFDVWHWPCTVGRALTNDLVLDDAFVAPHHASLEAGSAEHGGGARLRVGDSVNGITWQHRRLQRGETAELPADGALLQIGATRLRLRLRGETPAAERPLPALLPGSDRRLGAVALATLALAAASHWLVLDPGADATAWLPLAVGLPLALAGWCGLWALLSKLFQHRFDFLGHLRIALPWLLALEAVEAVLPPLAASLGWPLLWRLVPPGQALLLVLMIRAHLEHLLPQHRRAVGLAVAAAALAGGGVSLALTQRVSDSFSRAPYMSTLPLPALNLAGPAAPSALVQDMAPMAARLAERVRLARERDAADGGEDGAEGSE